MARGKKWTKKEDELLIKMCKQGIRLKDIHLSGKFDRSYSVLASRKSDLGLTNDRRDDFKPYSDEEIWKMWIYREQGYSRKEIAEKINRPVGGVAFKMTRFNLVYHPPLIPCPQNLIPIVEELGGLGK